MGAVVVRPLAISAVMGENCTASALEPRAYGRSLLNGMRELGLSLHVSLVLTNLAFQLENSLSVSSDIRPTEILLLSPRVLNGCRI